jgi:hypothetical protein
MRSNHVETVDERNYSYVRELLRAERQRREWELTRSSNPCIDIGFSSNEVMILRSRERSMGYVASVWLPMAAQFP